MGHHGKPLEFLPLRIAVLTVSDTRTLEDDTSGALLSTLLKGAGHILASRTIVADEQSSIEGVLRERVADEAVDVVISTGGTGITGRDVTPEAFAAVIDKAIPGFGELFRYLSFSKIGTAAIQSRALAGVAGNTYLFALPGSRGAVRDAWEGILLQQLDRTHRPCNFAELKDRLIE